MRYTVAAKLTPTSSKIGYIIHNITQAILNTYLLIDSSADSEIKPKIQRQEMQPHAPNQVYRASPVRW
jgi:hypothetical protein